MKLKYGKALIEPDTGRNRQAYGRRKPPLLRCACPGCQNFFRSAKPFADDMADLLAPLGILWSKPDKIEVIGAKDGEVSYRAVYTFYGKAALPPAWLIVEKNEAGVIRLRNPEAVYEFNDRLSFVFSSLKSGRLRLEVRLRLPWVMETINCIYSNDAEKPEKAIPSRAARLKKTVKYIYNKIR